MVVSELSRANPEARLHNQQAIHQAFRALLDDWSHRVPRGMPETLPLELAEGNFVAAYELIREDDRLIYIVKTNIFPPRRRDWSHMGGIARRHYFFERKRGNLIEVISSSRTLPDYQSRGYGTALMQISDEVIQDAMTLPELEGKRLRAVIRDEAKGIPKSDGLLVEREKWSSVMAESMRYSPSPRRKGDWIKEYSK